MSDLIDREDIPYIDLNSDMPQSKVRVWVAFKEQIDALPSAEPKTRWIPVSERLPIPPTFCLVTTDGKHGDVIDIALYMSDGWHKASEVLAWMPLPPPYEGGETV